MSIAHDGFVRDEPRASYDADHPAPVSLPRYRAMIDAELIDTIGEHLGSACLSVYLMLVRHANREHRCWPSQAHIATKLKLSDRHVRRAITALSDSGFVEITKRKNGYGMQASDEYFLPHQESLSEGKYSADIPPDIRADIPPDILARVVPGGSSTEVEESKNDPPKPKSKRATYPPEFESVWQQYPPGHGSKKESYAIWKRIDPDDELQAEIVAGLVAWKKSRRWLDGFVMDAERWFRGRRWENPESPASVSAQTQMDPDFVSDIQAKVRALSNAKPDPNHPGRPRF